MKNNVLTIMKKECKRNFSDKRLFFTTVLLPGLLMFTMYSLMGTFMGGFFDVKEDCLYQVHAVNLPDSIAEVLASEEHMINVLQVSEEKIEEIKQRISDRETDLLLVFPSSFDALVYAFDPQAATEPAPNIQIWANFARTESMEANRLVMKLLNDYHHALTHRFSINAPTYYAPYGDFNLATDADMFAMVFGMITPMLFIFFIYTGCQAIAPESIAGEKERGTLGSILVTPANRRDIALGKILGIAIFALMSAAASILGFFLAMSNMIGMESSNSFELYSIEDFVLLLLVATSTTFVFVSLLSVLSAYAKSIKEANSYSMPVFFIVFVAGLVGMFLGEVPTEIGYFLIPVANSALSIAAIFSFEANVLNILITTAVNIFVALIFTVILARIFSSEKIVFDK